MTIPLPRDVASAAIVDAVALAGRAVILLGLLNTGVLATDVLLGRGAAPGDVIHVLAPIVLVLILGIGLILRPSMVTVASFIVGGGVGSTAYVVMGLHADPGFDEPAPYVVNRLAVLLALVGGLGGSARSGILWSVLGSIVGSVSVAIGLMIAGQPVAVGYGPLLGALVLTAIYGALMLSRRQARLRVPDLDAVQREIEAAELRAVLEARSAALIHDTVLADLAAVSVRSGPIDDRLRRSLTADLSRVETSTAAPSADAPLATDRITLALLELAERFAWRGLTVHVSGAESVTAPVDERIVDTVVAAARAALDNVLAHAGTDRAELVVGVRDGILAVLVVDDGRGFDTVGSDRLGVRGSIHSRIESIGGTVRLWSGSEGTTVMMSVPVGDHRVVAAEGVS